MTNALKEIADLVNEPNLYSSSLKPGAAQKRFAVAFLVGLLTVFFLITWPLKGVHPGPIPAFIPAYATAMFVNDWITAILLYAQFSVLRTRALLIIASGYLYTALMVIAWAIVFPGMFGPNVTIGGLQSTSAAYVFWHVGFAFFAGTYALVQDEKLGQGLWRGTVASGIAVSFAATTTLALIFGIVCIAGESLLPPFVADARNFGPLWPYYLGLPVSFFSICAMAMLWWRCRSMLGLWLGVVMCLYVIEMPLHYYPDPVRFSVGFYAVRIIGLISSGLILIMLLREILTIYRLIGVQAQRREREANLMTGDAIATTIAHELKQPLSAMITRSGTGLRWLNRPVPEVERAKAEFKQISAEGHRANGDMERIRTNFRRDARIRTPIDINELIGETLTLARRDLQAHRITLLSNASARPKVVGDLIQLQQVLLNLITNAIDSMAENDGPRVLSVMSETRGDGCVVVSVADTGTGIASQNVEKVFHPLFSTKSGGMGMGLSVCRSIIEAHDGELSVAPNSPHGTVFQFSLVLAAATGAMQPPRQLNRA